MLLRFFVVVVGSASCALLIFTLIGLGRLFEGVKYSFNFLQHLRHLQQGTMNTHCATAIAMDAVKWGKDSKGRPKKKQARPREME